MADNYTFKDASGNTITHASEDIGGGVQASEHVSVDDAGVMIAKAEDAAHSSGDKGVMALAVRKDTAAALAGSDGDYIPLIVDANGRLHVAIGGGGLAGDVAHDAADSGNPLKLGGKAAASAPTAVSAGDRVNAYFDTNGRLMIDADLLRALLPATIGQKNKAGSLSVTLASDQAFDQASWPSSETPVRRLLSMSAQAAAAPLYYVPSAKYANIMDLHFSTDTQLAAALYQSNLADYAAAVVADGANHLYKCDESSGNLTDSIGALTGVAVGSSHTYQAASIVCADGKSVGINGSTQGFAAASAPASCANGAMEVWFYLNAASLGASAVIFSAADAGSTNAMLWIGLSTALKPQVTMRSGGVNRIVATGDLPVLPYSWNHMVWQHDGTGVNLWLNGVAQAITYSTGSDSSTNWYDDFAADADNLCVGFLRRTTDGSWFPGRVALAAWYDDDKAASVWENHYALGMPLWGPHFFAAYTGVSGALRAPLQTETATTIYLNTSTAGNVTCQLSAVEVAA